MEAELFAGGWPSVALGFNPVRTSPEKKKRNHHVILRSTSTLPAKGAACVSPGCPIVSSIVSKHSGQRLELLSAAELSETAPAHAKGRKQPPCRFQSEDTCREESEHRFMIAVIKVNKKCAPFILHACSIHLRWLLGDPSPLFGSQVARTKRPQISLPRKDKQERITSTRK